MSRELKFRNLIKKSNSGFVTFDYLFAFMMVFGFFMVMFSLSLTLTMAEITQYVTFATARTYAGAHKSEDVQKELALRKYRELTGSKVLGPLYKNGWFSIFPQPEVGDVGKNFPAYKNAPRASYVFFGAGTEFNAKMLDIKIPFFGSTANTETKSSGFVTYIGSYVWWEVPDEPCRNFNRIRWIKFKVLTESYTNYKSAPSDTYAVQTDNGC